MTDDEIYELKEALAEAQGRARAWEGENARLKAEVESLRAAARSRMLQTHAIGPPVIIEIVPARPRPILTTNTPKPKGGGFISTHGRPMPDEAAARHRLIESIKEKRRAAAKKGK